MSISHDDPEMLHLEREGERALRKELEELREFKRKVLALYADWQVNEDADYDRIQWDMQKLISGAE